jgi:hypothetical protein
MPVTVCYLENNIVLVTLKIHTTVQLPDIFIHKLLHLYTLLHRNSLLFLNETITILADGISCSLFDLGLGVTNFLSFWPSANTFHTKLLHNSVLAFTYQQTMEFHNIIVNIISPHTTSLMYNSIFWIWQAVSVLKIHCITHWKCEILMGQNAMQSVQSSVLIHSRIPFLGTQFHSENPW